MEVNRQSLQALAGWTIANAGRGIAHDNDLVALRDACERVIESLPTTAATEIAKPAASPPIKLADAIQAARRVQLPPVACTPAKECHHRFHIRTQLCVFCGSSYRDVRQRESEFMGRVS